MNIEQELLKAHSRLVTIKTTSFLRSWREVDHERFEEKEPEYANIISGIVEQMESAGLDTDTHLQAGGRFIVDQLRHNEYNVAALTPITQATYQDNTHRFVIMKKRGRPVGSKKVKTSETTVTE